MKLIYAPCVLNFHFHISEGHTPARNDALQHLVRVCFRLALFLRGTQDPRFATYRSESSLPGGGVWALTPLECSIHSLSRFVSFISFGLQRNNLRAFARHGCLRPNIIDIPLLDPSFPKSLETPGSFRSGPRTPSLQSYFPVWHSPFQSLIFLYAFRLFLSPAYS
jgi:hypothetical protein